MSGDSQKGPSILVMADSRVGSLPAVHPAAGHRSCRRQGLHRVWKTATFTVCPGCKRACRLPEEFERGQEFHVVDKPR